MDRMNWKNIKKRAAVFLFTVLLCAGCLTGCGGRVRVVFTAGLSGKQIFKIGSEECTLPEAMVYLTTFYSRYADAYGPEMWDYDFGGGVSLENNVKEIVLSKLTQIKIMNLMAEEKGISLTAEEKKKTAAAAQEYCRQIDGKLRSEEGITEKLAAQVFEEYATANKVYETITESGDMEISDDEARTVTVQILSVPTEADASAVLKRVKAGADFETAALHSGGGKAELKSYARGETDKELEEMLFSLDTGEIGVAVENSGSCMIAKCISTMDYEATQANKLVLAKKRKSEAFSDAYRDIELNTPMQFRKKLWEKVSMKEDIHRTRADFFAVYKQYVK